MQSWNHRRTVSRVKITHPDRVLFPEAGLTKADLAGYYERVAPLMLLHLKDRPVSMQRYPDGIEGGGFFHKDAPDYFPDWIARAVMEKSGGSVTHAVVNNADSLVYLANHGTITPHVWLSRADMPRRPDRLVFDLDPSREDFAAVRRGARHLAALLAELGLRAYPMVTGSRGIHLWVPVRRDRDTDQVKAFTRAIAKVAAERHPEELTNEWRKAKRLDRILVDVARHGYAQTVVPPFAVRPRPGAPVAMPVSLDDLGDSKLRPDRWTIQNAFRRLGQADDPWSGFFDAAPSLAQPEKKLSALAQAL
jgi:bifunctional non-homologous end joining protein LigD